MIRVKTMNELVSALKKFNQKDLIIIAEADPGNESVPIIDLEPVEVKRRFMRKHDQ